MHRGERRTAPDHREQGVRGTNGDDILRGNGRDNNIFGLRGWDDLYGYGGRDLLDGGRGEDLLIGGRGRDALWGGRGKDFLEGGRGNDDFWFNTRDSHDIVNDFRAGDALIIDVQDGGFEGVRRRDLFIDEGPKFDKLYVDGDYVAKVYGDVLFYSDVILI
jgi:Ca2+-binding RTX toxin-like protein